MDAFLVILPAVPKHSTT